MKLKTLLATVLLCLCATTMSAQAIVGNGNAANKIINAQINDEEYANIVTSLETSCAIVLHDETLRGYVVAKKDALNKEIAEFYAGNPEKYNEEWALDQLEEYIVNLEKKQGDINLDGDFDVFDIDDLYEAIFDPALAFDFNGDGDIDAWDVDDLYDALFK